MNKVFFTAILTGNVFLLTTACKSYAPPRTESYYRSYQIECVGDSSQGSQLVHVWAFVKPEEKKFPSIDEIRRFAVHGVIFKGVGGNGCTPQKPMASSPAIEQQRADFFETFFNQDKAYNNYAYEVRGNAPETTLVGFEFKISAIVSVSTEKLRRDLEAAGVIGGQSGGNESPESF